MTDRERTAVQLREDLPLLTGQGILDEESARRLLAYYPLPPKHDYRKRLLLYFGMLGALLVGGGSIMIIAHNWDMLALSGRLAVAFTPVVLTWLFGAWVLCRKAGSAVWRETAAILILSALGAGIGIVSQQYHSTGTLPELCVVLMLFDVFLIYRFHSSCALLLYAAGYAVNVGFPNFELFFCQPFYLLLLLVIPVLPRIVRTLRFHPWGWSAQACRISLTVMLAVLAGLASDRTGRNFAPYLWAVFSACLLRFGLLSARVSRFNPFLLAGLAGMVIECSILSFRSSWNGMTPIDLQALSALTMTAVVVASVFYLAVSWISLMRDDKFIVWIPLIFPLLVLANVFYPMPWIAFTVFNGYFLFGGVYLLTRGVRRRRMWFLNFGMCVLLLWVFLRFCSGSDNYLVNGLVFVFSGALLFAVNYFFVRGMMRRGRAV